RRDREKAKDFFEKSSNLGNSEGMKNFGYAMLESNSLSTDVILEAIKLFKKSFKLGNSGAILCVGDIYHGNNEDVATEYYGFKKDIPKAIKYYQKAISVGDLTGMIRIARIYEEECPEKMFEWYSKA